MLFNSVLFITIFLPLALIGWYVLQKLHREALAKCFLIGMSLWFYGYYNPRYLGILCGSILFNQLFSISLEHTRRKPLRKGILAVGLTANLGALFYFKYFNFFLDNCNFFLHTQFEMEKIALPLGISFFTFQQISFLVDRYREEAPCYPFLDYACFISFFPQLIAGPIVRHHEFIPQLLDGNKHRLKAENLFDGLSLFILGLGKKMILADLLAVYVNAEYNNIPALDAPSAWLVIIFYMLELYFDFSGYCDMARGIGKLFGFVLPENFNSPLMAVSVRDFWRRWHMTLSRFLMQYIYIPLGGNRKGLARKCVNLMVVFLVSGIWHGANWTFVVWGLLHGIAVVWESLFPRLRFRSDKLNRLFTGLYVTLAFSVFRSESLPQALLLFRKLFAGGNGRFLIAMSNVLQIPETYVIRSALMRLAPGLLNPFYVIAMFLILFVALAIIAADRAEVWLEKKGRSMWGLFLLATIFTWSFLSLSHVSVFLYFNF